MEDALMQAASKNTDFLSILAARGVCRSWRSTCPRLVRSIVFDDSTIFRLRSISNLDQANAACRNAVNAMERIISELQQLDSLHLNITLERMGAAIMCSLEQRQDLWPKLKCVSLAMNPYIALENGRKDELQVIKGFDIGNPAPEYCSDMGRREGTLNEVCVRMGRLERTMPPSLLKVFFFRMELGSIVNRPKGIFSGLLMLKLETAAVSFDEFMQLSDMCTSLEHLYLKDVLTYDHNDEEIVCLSFSRLLTFHLDGYSDTLYNHRITLDAPRLQQLYFMPNFEKSKFATQGTCLKEATCYEIIFLNLEDAPALRKLSLVGTSSYRYILDLLEGNSSKGEIVSLLTLAQHLEELEVGPYITMKVTCHWNTSEIGCLPAINLLTMDVHPKMKKWCKDGLVRFALMFREVKQIKLRGGIEADLLQFQNGCGSHLISRIELIPRT